jgi:hypothetical protein
VMGRIEELLDPDYRSTSDEPAPGEHGVRRFL